MTKYISCIDDFSIVSILENFEIKKGEIIVLFSINVNQSINYESVNCV